MAKYIFFWLVVSTLLKNMKVSWDDYSQYIEKIKIDPEYALLKRFNKVIEIWFLIEIQFFIEIFQ